ncbi:MAG: M20/M25/M40 family metallo-hydrolase [Firmicutes bacterium]|nr:M20/M25/M40 family metallo-hydrolase [Bacillota bacterium]
MKTLASYVNIETPSRAYEQLQMLNDLFEKDLREGGAQTGRIPKDYGDILIARMGNGPRQILLLGHKDTVFRMGTIGENPYREVVREGQARLRGPGVLDMKAGDVFALEIFRHFKDHLPDSWSIVGVFNSDEEIGSHQSEEVIRAFAKKSIFALCLEPSIPGYCTIGRKGLAGYEITVEGKAAHSGTAYLEGASAVEALSRIISRIYDLRDDEKKLSVNIGAIEAGGRANIVCPRAWATGEARCFDPALLKETLEKIQQFCDENPVPGTKASLKIRGIRPPMVQSEEGRALFELARERAAAHGLSLEGRIHGGGSDGSFVSDEGIPVLDGMGAEGEGAHTLDEFVVKNTLMDRLKVCIDVIESVIINQKEWEKQ